jgi:DksA/TraR C4-type zinc finger protein
MRRSRNGQHLSEECLDACRVQLTAVLERLITGRLHEGTGAIRSRAGSPVCQSSLELGLYCSRYLAANRMNWSAFLVQQVSEALERIDSGSYGLCLQCGQPISAKRLTALPWVALCIGCQEGKSRCEVT